VTPHCQWQRPVVRRLERTMMMRVTGVLLAEEAGARPGPRGSCVMPPSNRRDAALARGP
jgi:hypothetical protein